LSFEEHLVTWFRARKRDLPWRTDRTPFSILVSEIMLQQTTADVVAERFPVFLKQFPTIGHLANAEESAVVRAWSGLGYYRRARSLHQAARQIVARFEGKIPSTVDELSTLPGIGEYTAGAIASLAYGVRVAAVDGNVARVASRLFLDDGIIDLTKVKRRLGERLLQMLERSDPAEFNEALIELGATICRPADPKCKLCPLVRSCEAYKANRAAELPRRKARPETIPVLSARVLIRKSDRVLLYLRPESERRLPGLFEFPGEWFPAGTNTVASLADALAYQGLDLSIDPSPISHAKHSITNHRIQSELYPAKLRGGAPKTMHWCDATPATTWTTESRKLMIRSNEGSSL
jgi:A/G-specific adenine glycosylase